MGRPAKGPRLWLQPERCDVNGKLTHAATWIILDKSNRISTQCGFDQLDEAESKLYLYSTGQLSSDELCLNRLSSIYFVTCDVPDFPIKIGSAFDVEIRLKAIQTALPWPVQTLLVIDGGSKRERELHALFSHLRMRGEWFERHPSILEHIRHCASVFGRAA